MFYRKLFLAFLLFGAAIGVTHAQDIGLFQNMFDVGEPDLMGYAEFDGETYLVEGVGTSVGNETFVDQCTLLYNEMAGSFAIEAYVDPIDAGEGGLMVRASLEQDAPSISFLMNPTFQSFPHIRTIKGGGTIYDGDPEPAVQTKMRLERLGNSIHFYQYNTAGNVQYVQTEVGLFGETVLAGLAANGGSASGIGLFYFTEVAIEEFPLNVIRSVPTDTLSPGAALKGIAVTAEVRSGQTVNAIIHEVAPDGATISNVVVSSGQTSVNRDGSINWTLSGASGDATMTYDLTLGNDDTSAVWRGTFNDGVHRESYISGDMLLPKAPTYTPKGPFTVDPMFPTIIQAEWCTPTDRARNEDFGFFFDPRKTNGIALIAMDEPVADSLLQFTLNIPETGTYYFFGNAREEDGNSDSFYTEVDAPPVADDTARWNVSTNKDFQIQWVSRESPVQDPRPFQLTAGEHVFNLQSREDSASIDWIGVTTNPSLDLAHLNLDARAIASRTVSDDFLETNESGASVELSVFVKSGVTDTAILTEQPPSAVFGVSNVSAGMGQITQNADGSITWNLTGVTGKRATLSYNVNAPSVRGNAAIGGNFSGEFVLGSDDPINMLNTIAAAGEPIAPIGKTAYFFGNIDAQDLYDRITVSDLKTLFGLEVVLLDDGNTAGYEMPANLSGSDMAVISGTVGSSNVGNMNYHVNDVVPIVSYENWLHDDYAFQPDTQIDATGTEIEIVDNTHPITQGLDLGPLQVFQSSHGMGGMSDPPQGIHLLAIAVGDPSIALLWVFDRGATANGQTTPGLRIGLFSPIDSAALTPAGRNLLNRCYAYALGIETPDTAVENYMLY